MLQIWTWCSALWRDMQNGCEAMKEFRKFITKEFLHIFRDQRTILIVLIMPIVQIVLFGYAVSTDINNARVDIVGDMGDRLVMQIAERMDNNRYLQVESRYESPMEVGGRFRRSEVDVAVCFEKDFEKKLTKNGRASVKIIGDASDPNSAQVIVNYVTGVINDVVEEINGQDGVSSSGRMPTVEYVYNPAMKSSYNFVPGVMSLILMLICSMMTAISIVREKENGTLELLLVSPIRPAWIIISKAVPYLVLSVVNLVTIFLLSRYVIDVPVRGSMLLIALVSLVFIFASLSLGLLISTVASTQRVALLISGMGMMMPTMIFSGVIFPCESMPVVLQWVSDIIPAKWYIIMIKKVMIEGVGLEYIVKELVILSSMAVFLFVTSVKLFKTRL